MADLKGMQLAVLGRKDLLVSKKASGHPKDLADVAWLESQDNDN